MKKVIFFVTIAFIMLIIAERLPADESKVSRFPTKGKYKKVVTNERPWLEEEEFQRDGSLHATLDQVIILHLEPSRITRKYHERDESDRHEYRKRKPFHWRQGIRRNTIRYLVSEPTDVGFCIPPDEPHIRMLKLTDKFGRRILRTWQGEDCSTETLEPGRYRLRVFHDGTDIGPEGVKAFFHRPGQARLLGSSQNDFMVPNFMAFRGPNGNFVSDNTGDAPLLSLQAIAPTVGANEVWRLGPSSPYTFTDGKGVGVKQNIQITAQFVGSSGDPGDYIASYKIADLGNGQFKLTFFGQLGGSAPINVRNAEQQLFRSSTNHATFTADYKGFDCKTCDSSTLSLQEGEVALFAGCNYTGPAIVFQADVPDFSIYDAAAELGLGLGDDMAASARIGPNTFAILYSDAQFSGTFQGISEDIPCLDQTAFGSSAASSLQVTEDIRQFVIATKVCENCDLSGVDLSDLDFTAGEFTGTNFSDANLTNTIFRSARLDHATLSGAATILAGTDLADAVLFCTDLSGTDLSTTAFDDDPIITKDFSCRLDLSGTTLPINVIPFASWRYLNLTGAMIINGTGTTISTLTNPIDLSGALLSGVTGLSGVILDGADLNCVAGADNQDICTQLIDTDLSKASLMQANLVGAAMNGANLIQTNLEMADLSGAQLLKSPNTQESAKLSGAYLKNVNLSMADLSGAILTNANWYSTTAEVCNGSTWSGNCASGQGATLSNADLAGAYLNGVDLSGAILQGANLGGAMLVGVNLTGANLSGDPSTGSSTAFSGAFLQGANFTDAIPTGADYFNAYVDLASATGGSMVFQLPIANLEFTGYWKDPAEPECVLFSYTQQTTVPDTDSANTCPDGSNGPCSAAQWTSPSTPIGQAQPPSSSDFPTDPAGACTIFGDIDFDW